MSELEATDTIPIANTVHECPHCGFTSEDKSDFPINNPSRHGASTRKCPDCDDYLKIL